MKRMTSHSPSKKNNLEEIKNNQVEMQRPCWMRT